MPKRDFKYIILYMLTVGRLKTMDIVQDFYDKLAPQYDKLFLDWKTEVTEQGSFLSRLFEENGFDTDAEILDCACGIGTQAIGLANSGYKVTASDISSGALAEAKIRAKSFNADISFETADFRCLSEVFTQKFDIAIAMDNALPHMLSKDDLKSAIKSITDRIKEGGIFVGSIRDYDALLKDKPPYSAPYIHKTDKGQRVSFQTWHWSGECYKLVQYIIDDSETLEVSKFECEYRATTRDELTALLLSSGCKDVLWLFPEESGFYQPIVIARKSA